MTYDPFAFVDGLPAADRTKIPVALGGELTYEFVLAALRRGVVVMPAIHSDDRAGNRARFEPGVTDGSIILMDATDDPYGLTWWLPVPRYILRPANIRRRREAEKRARREGWTLTFDASFSSVVSACSEGRRRHWMSADYQAIVNRMHEDGLAHSVEVWERGALVGGTYGIVVGQVLISESVFNRVDHAGKVAMAGMASVIHQSGGEIIDWQFVNPLGERMGVEVVSNEEFTSALRSDDQLVLHGCPQYPFRPSA